MSAKMNALYPGGKVSGSGPRQPLTTTAVTVKDADDRSMGAVRLLKETRRVLAGPGDGDQGVRFRTEIRKVDLILNDVEDLREDLRRKRSGPGGRV